ncbi:MAG TPA: diguanylate cyclase [Cellvibrio sp.]|nr:diguanylate cyclase [Cellvibrio sp.]
MIRITPAIRLSLGLIVLVASILILAQAIGLAPNNERQQVNQRMQLAETLASQISLAVIRGDSSLIKSLLDNAVERNPEVASTGVRRTDGVIVAQTDQHEKNWQGNTGVTTPTHITIPIIISGSKRGEFEISYKPIEVEHHPFIHLPIFVVLVVFVCISGFIGFWLYIRRVLQHLDPSAVVPARVRNALNILAEGVLILDRREQIVLANQALIDHLHREEKSLIGKKASQLGWTLDVNQDNQAYPWLTAQTTGTKQIGVRVLLQQEDNKQKVFHVNAVPILDAKSASQGTIVVFEDVTELEEKSQILEKLVKELADSRAAVEIKNKELSFLATRDPMTNCFNRRAFYQQLDEKFAGARSSDAEYSCIMADIDFFKKVNDTYGHSVGDDVIKMAASSLTKMVRDVDIVARFGGEEFCILLPTASLDQAYMIAERCREEIGSRSCGEVKVTASFGVTSIRLGATTPAELVQQADEALYYSKQNGRNRATCWKPGMQMTDTGAH